MKDFFNFLNENNIKYKFNKIIDFTYIKQDSNIDKIKNICNTAKEYNFYSICIKPDYISYAKNFLSDTNIKICSMISYPFGNDTIKEKIKLIDKSIINGADEIDMVLNYKKIKKISSLKDEDKKNKELISIKENLYDITRKCHGLNNVLLKIIIETSELTYDEIKIACDICIESDVDYIQTSTGYFKGADIDKVKFMRKILPDTIGIKASGGIRTLNDIQNFVNAGADRIGTSVVPYDF
jgi:deoxyribose-phosphate aldolase